jgi:isopenicillin-N epimerase
VTTSFDPSDRIGAHHWHLDPDVVHLNHGSYGAVPIPVLDAQFRVARTIERSPERFYRADLAPALDEVRTAVARFLGTDPEGLALVQNATEATQVVLDAVALGAGDEVVCTDHGYPWVRAAIDRVCQARGAQMRCVPLPLAADSGADAGALVSALRAATTKRTALVVIDQITSSSALLLPVEQVIASVGDGVPVMIDGAHAPGLIDRPVPDGAAFWLGNLHKWAFSARTAAALVVAPAFRARVRPLVASARAADGYPRAFDYLGTQDASAFLALPEALSFPEKHLGMGFPALRERNRRALVAGTERLAAHLPIAPAPDAGLPIRTLPLGHVGGPEDASHWAAGLREAGVEVAIVTIGGRLHARVSVQAYVAVEDFDRLGTALERFAGHAGRD